MKGLFLMLFIIGGTVSLLSSCKKARSYDLDHEQKWYEYGLKRGPGISGFSYEFNGDRIIARMFVASFIDNAVTETAVFEARIVGKSELGYDIVSESGTRGFLRFEGGDLLLEWADRELHEPQRRLSSAFPDLAKLRAVWECEAGQSVDEFVDTHKTGLDPGD